MSENARTALELIDCLLKDVEATQGLAGAIADRLEPGFRLYLCGGLGAGKTTFTRALLASLGFPGRVKSPTFALLEPYNLSRFELHHYDFYRLDSPEAWREAGFETSFDGRVVVVIEWPERAGGTLPPADLELRIELAGEAQNEQGLESPFKRRDGSPRSNELDAQGDGLESGARIARLRALSARGQACLSALIAAGCCVRAHSPGSA